MCFGSVAVAVLSLLINTYYTGKMINVGFLVQIGDLLPSLLMSLAMGGLVWLLTMSIDSMWLKLIVGIPSGIASYWMLSFLFKVKDYPYLVCLIKDIIITPHKLR